MAGMEFGGSKVFPTDTIRPSMSKYSSENLLYMGIWRIQNRMPGAVVSVILLHCQVSFVCNVA